MLKTIPFHASLLKREMAPGVKAGMSHVLLYGAIEIHAMGPKGCIASNTRLGKELGLSNSRVANLLTDLGRAGWIIITMDKDNHRVGIEPIGDIKFDTPPSQIQQPPLAGNGNIYNSLDNNTSYRASEDANAPKEKEEGKESTTLKLFYLVVKQYRLPVLNHNHIRKWAKDLNQLDDGEAYLQQLLDTDLRQAEGDFRPTLNTAADVIQKKLKIQRFLNNGEDTHSLTPAEQNRMAEEEMRRRNAAN